VNSSSINEIVGSVKPVTYELTSAQRSFAQRYSVAQPWLLAIYFVAGGLALASAWMGVLVRHHLDLAAASSS